MGTGSRGGGSGGGGSGGGGSGGGGYLFKDGAVISNVRPLTEVEQQITKLLSDPNRRNYFLRQFTNSMIRDVYQKVYALVQQLTLNRSWAGVQREYDIPNQAGSLKRWLESVCKQHQNQEPDQRMRDVIQNATKRFLLQCIGNDVRLYISGTGSEIASRIDPRIIERTSNNFLTGVIREVILRERELQVAAPETEVQITRDAQNRADRIIAQFENRFRDPPRVTYNNLFEIITTQQEWFVKALRR